MRIERYYSSVREELSPLSVDAKFLLESQDYVGFFKSCGPNYIRSIRRVQEITTIFKFASASKEVAKSFAAGLKRTGASANSTSEDSIVESSKFDSITSSLEIKILGFGLGLSESGSSTLVSTTLSEFNEVMKFAYNSFTRSEDANDLGMVYGVEIVPWVDNTAFQIASKLLEESVEIPVPRSLIPKAYMKVKVRGVDPIAWNNTKVGRELFKCKSSSFSQDKYGYCCEGTSLYNTKIGEYEVEDPNDISALVCRPRRRLDKSVVKNNMANNAEFVARLDSVMRTRINQLFMLELCISQISDFPHDFDYYKLQPQETNRFDIAVSTSYSVKLLKNALDPLGDRSLVIHMGKELDEYLDMYYQPCVAELFGANIGSTPDVESQYFMAYSWLSHKTCSMLACLTSNVRWDRVREGCVAGLMEGSNSEPYDQDDSVNIYCNKDDEIEDENEHEVCKHNSLELYNYRKSVTDCWGNTLRPNSLMRNFCMPKLAGGTISDEEQVTLDSDMSQCSYRPGTSLRNIALLKTTTSQSTTYSGSHNGEDYTGGSELAVDGNRNSHFYDGSVTSTDDGQSDPWWKINLEEKFDIKYINIYNRRDNGSDQLFNVGLTVVIKENGIVVFGPISPTFSVTDHEIRVNITPGNIIEGDEVMISIPGGTILTLAEVEVMAYIAD